MPIVSIIGGLGNQMFQYAFMQELEHGTGYQVKADLTRFDSYPLHNGYELDRIFGIKTLNATRAEVKKISNPPENLIDRIRRKYFTKKTHYIDKVFSYDEQVFNLPENTYFEGFWQSEKYFSSVIPQIKKDFTFAQPLAKKNTELLAQVGTNTVSVHVRRGDYLKSHNLNICNKNYYNKAIQYIQDTHKDQNKAISSFLIFSDDIDWCREHLEFKNVPAHFIDWNTGKDSWQDMAMMSQCTHNIIANSSFSWWGAWLNANADKLVIAPKIWNGRELYQNDSYYTYSFDDVCPENWIRIDI